MKTTFLVIVGIFAAVILFGLASRASDPLTAEKDSARRAIDSCDKGWKDDLLPANARLMMRNTCDQMRNEYTTKYGRAP
ncbi:MAG: hypothetical protein V4451_16000 [Pseudomonadota bacterium]